MPPQLTGICTALPTRGLGAPQHLILSWGKCSSAGLNPSQAFMCFLRDLVLLQPNRDRCEGHLHQQPSAARLVLTFPSCHVLLPGRLSSSTPPHSRSKPGNCSPRACPGGHGARTAGKGLRGPGRTQQGAGRKEARQHGGAEQSPPGTFRRSLDLQARDECRGERLQAARGYECVDVFVGKAKRQY